MYRKIICTLLQTEGFSRRGPAWHTETKPCLQRLLVTYKVHTQHRLHTYTHTMQQRQLHHTTDTTPILTASSIPTDTENYVLSYSSPTPPSPIPSNCGSDGSSDTPSNSKDDTDNAQPKFFYCYFNIHEDINH